MVMKKTRIVDVVMNQVKKDPRVFKALKDTGGWTKAVNMELEKTYTSSTASAASIPSLL